MCRSRIIHGPESSCSKMKVANNLYKFYGRPLDEEEDGGELALLQFSVYDCSSVF